VRGRFLCSISQKKDGATVIPTTIKGVVSFSFWIPVLLRLSQNMAGVTIMAFGNGAPGILSALKTLIKIDLKQKRIEKTERSFSWASVFKIREVTRIV
jgi:hypothetical protein